jgi:hypothetical protein
MDNNKECPKTEKCPENVLPNSFKSVDEIIADMKEKGKFNKQVFFLFIIIFLEVLLFLQFWLSQDEI